MRTRIYAPYNNLALLKIADEDTTEVLVCHFFRERTRASMSVLIVG